MKKINWFIVMVAMFAFTLPMGCGDYEHQKKDKQAGELCANDGDCFGDLVCGNEREKKGVCTTWDVARCNDGVQNYSESDADCGWSCRMTEPPNLCPAGKKCAFNADCDGTKNLVCNDGICGQPRNTQCSSANPCPAGQNCLGGACVLSTVCTPACTSGFVCINNACTSASFQDKLCATPTVACNITCWNQFQVGVMDINAQFVAANQQLCCPSTSGSFSLPNGTPGSYTGWHGETTARPFEPFNNVFGGYK
jgi:hypothetical protein